METLGQVRNNLKNYGTDLRKISDTFFVPTTNTELVNVISQRLLDIYSTIAYLAQKGERGHILYVVCSERACENIRNSQELMNLRLESSIGIEVEYDHVYNPNKCKVILSW